jgi:signal transduction histidine kinase
MSLRARLTILYASLLGGILLFFGVVMHVAVSDALVGQVDSTLSGTVDEIIANSRVDSVGEMQIITLPSLELTANVYVQLWEREGRLTTTSPAIENFLEPLDPLSINAARPVFSDSYVSNTHLRVLTVPLRIGNRPAGFIQAASPLALVDSIRSLMTTSLVLLTIASIALAAVVSWFAIGQALAPLKDATETADQITRADDLSRRIPYDGPQDDEIGRLVQAFNRSLARLERLFTSQQRFLADVSHELRTPLTVIKGNADLIRKLGPDEESGRLPLNLKAVEIDTLLTEVLQEMRVLAGQKVKLKLTEIDQAVINADRDRLKQVLINLTSNAIQYTPAGGQVTLAMTKSTSQVFIRVADTGPGIPAKDLPHIFERFYRAEKSRTRSKTSGFGLGLSIASWIVEHHKGKMEVDSKEGQGTTFTLTLPLQGQ